MIDWAFVLTPLLVLPIVLVFRFVGCETFHGSDAPVPPPNPPPTFIPYWQYILGMPGNPGTVPNPAAKPIRADIIGYWRLVDDPTLGVAKDETGFQNGVYVKGLPIAGAAGSATDPGSEAAPGGWVTGEKSLISTDPVSTTCSFFYGGYVVIPYKPGLYTAEMTIECWIKTKWSMMEGYAHTLFFAGGHYTAPSDMTARYHGFQFYGDGYNLWQTFFNQQANPGETPIALNHSALGTEDDVPTHLAFVLRRDSSAVIHVELWVDGKSVGSAAVGVFDRPEGAPFYIGIMNASTADPPDPMNVVQSQPILSSIQEVVLYSKALSAEEIANHVAVASNPRPSGA